MSLKRSLMRHLTKLEDEYEDPKGWLIGIMESNRSGFPDTENWPQAT